MEIQEQIKLAEAIIAEWSMVLQDTVVQVDSDTLHCAGIAYEAGGLLVEHFLAHDKKNKLFEGAAVIRKEEMPVFIDRLLLVQPLCRVGLPSSASLLADDMTIASELNRTPGCKETFAKELKRLMKMYKAKPEFLESAAVAARGHGESIAAVSGGLPTLGKRR